MLRKLYNVFCGSGGSCVKSDKSPQVMSLESALVGAEDYKFENENIWRSGVRMKWAHQTSVARCSSLLEASSPRNTPESQTEVSAVELHCG